MSNDLIVRVDGIFRNEKAKTPLNLSKSIRQSMEKEGLYVWGPGVQQTKWQGPFLFFLIIGVIAACCFPIWPIWAKLGLWYLSVVLLCLILGVAIIRYIVFGLLFIVGIEFWILPNMLDDRAGFWETFSPLYFYRKRGLSCCELSFRIIFFLFFSSIGIYLYIYPETISQIQEFTVDGLKEVINWGEEKILSNSTQISGIHGYRKYEDILREDEEIPQNLKIDDEENN